MGDGADDSTRALKAFSLSPRASSPESSDEEELPDTKNYADERWETMYQRLVAYKAKYGHVNVKSRCQEDAQLGFWVSTQRRQFKKALASSEGSSNSLNLERKRKLDDLGFQWSAKDPNSHPWDARYNQLKSFVAKYGHALVPIKWKENPQLASWVSRQRQEYKQKMKGYSARLTDERIALLNELSFEWNPKRGAPRRDEALQPLRASADAREPQASAPTPQAETQHLAPDKIVSLRGSSSRLGTSCSGASSGNLETPTASMAAASNAVFNRLFGDLRGFFGPAVPSSMRTRESAQNVVASRAASEARMPVAQSVLARLSPEIRRLQNSRVTARPPSSALWQRIGSTNHPASGGRTATSHSGLNEGFQSGATNVLGRIRLTDRLRLVHTGMERTGLNERLLREAIQREMVTNIATNALPPATNLVVREQGNSILQRRPSNAAARVTALAPASMSLRLLQPAAQPAASDGNSRELLRQLARAMEEHNQKNSRPRFL